MSILATGQISIVDLSDGKSLSCYIASNQPRFQVQDVNAGTFSPDWSTTAGKVVLTPVIYADQEQLSLNDAALSISWKRKEGSGNETALAAGETASGGVLTVTQNKLSGISAATLTYLVYVTYTDPDTGTEISAVASIDFASVKTGLNGQNAKNCWISGEQVFKYASGSSTPNPSQITLTANVQNVTVSKWQYKDSSGVWRDYPVGDGNATITGQTLVVKPSHAVWVNDVASIRVLTSDSNIGDTTSVYKVADGAVGGPGAAASVVMLTNENVTFAGNASGQVSATSVVCNVVAYTGATKVTPTVGSVTGAPTGMTVSVGSAVNNEIPITLTIAANATLGGAGQRQGTLSVPITSPVTTTLNINWSKVNTGATGATGASAVVFSLYAPNGTVFTNQEGSKTIATAAYLGATPITGSYVWKKYVSGSWNTISGQTGSTLTVAGTDVVGVQAYKCEMTYNSVVYSDVITLIDKTDNYQASIESTGGNVFKNTVGTSCLICRVWQNGIEKDALKSAVISQTAPESPTEGTFYYKIAPTTPQVALMRYTSGSWVDVTDNATYKHVRSYTWYRRDKDGKAMDGGEAFATGKVIFIDGDDVTGKTTFTCEVS